ncbi:MAG TPA: carboxypeptidase-like regulatory domain-containing protein, partial [Bryobacteraceae bacterium]|nr:carboxypeptidase-like regulatory domain-containing protein [Bryobacteraceae bacterium]
MTTVPSSQTLRYLHYLALALVLSLPLAQAAVTGRVTGAVKDPTGAGIPGAMLTATNTEQNTQIKTTTDAKG